MTDRPVLFSAPMIRALLEGRKTMTRRILKPQPDIPNGAEIELLGVEGNPRPHITINCLITSQVLRWSVGDRLWVREAGATISYPTGHDPIMAKDIWSVIGWKHTADGVILSRKDPITDDIEAYIGDCSFTSRPSIHMPRWASRLTLTVTNVRIERVQDISEADALSEAIETTGFWREEHPASICFAALWNSIHGPLAWDRNDWVSVTSFSVERRNIDA